MLTLINTNRMMPPIAPIGLDYLAGAVREAGHGVELVDLCLANEPDTAMLDYFSSHRPDLVGLSLRNVDDCFLAGSAWFVPDLRETVRHLRAVTDAPIVIGGVGYSIFPRDIVEYCGADFGIHGDGERAVVELLGELAGRRRFDRVDGLVWRENGTVHLNCPAHVSPPTTARRRDVVDNRAYFRLGGQIGLETSRGCNRRCIYCPEPRIKGAVCRSRDPRLVADEVESLLGQGVDVLHLCDSEFNIPVAHARAVCEEFIRRGLGRRIRWYAYLAVVPFDEGLARDMREAGCVGINFTGDSASAAMLARYAQRHTSEDIARSVRLCRENGITVMIDLLIGGPGETPQTAAESIQFVKRIEPDCVGAGLGVRLYPETEVLAILAAGGPLEHNPGVRRKYAGPIDLLRPTFYVSPGLGEQPAQLVRDLIGGDQRFFEPADDIGPDTKSTSSGDHNYNDSRELVTAIANGARGAYWDILRKIRDAGQ